MSSGAGVLNYMGVGQETTYGTPVAATKFLPLLGSSFEGSENVEIPKPIDGTAERYKAVPGRRTVSGSITPHPDGDSLGLPLRWGNRAVTTANVAGPTSLVADNPSAGGSLPTSALYWKVANAFKINNTSPVVAFLTNLSSSVTKTPSGGNLTVVLSSWVNSTLATSDPRFTLLGTAVFRSTDDTAFYYLANVTGATTTYTDNGGTAISTMAAPSQTNKTHKFVGGTAEQKSFTVEAFLDITSSIQWEGMVTGGWSLSIPNAGPIQFVMDALIGQDYSTITATSPSFTRATPFIAHRSVCHLQTKGSADTYFAKIRSFDLKVNNNLEPKVNLDGTNVISGVLSQADRNAEGSFVVQLEDTTHIARIRANTLMALRILLWGDPIDGGTFSQTINSETVRAMPYLLDIDMPEMMYEKLEGANVDGLGQKTQALSFSQLLYNSTKGYSLQLTLWNDIASY